MPDQRKSKEVSEDWSVVNSEVAISRQLLTDTAMSVYLAAPLFFALDTPERRAKWEAKRREREAEWDAKTSAGLIGLVDHGDYECGPVWVEGRRGEFIEKWTTPKKFARYQATVMALEKAENAL